MKTTLQRNPVYQQLNDHLRDALGGEYRCGDKFLSEREISQRFEVSRATANKALASLVSEGLLEFRRGVGTFVRRDLINYDVRSLVSFTEKAKAAGKKPSTKVLSLRKVAGDTVDGLILEALEVRAETAVWKMKRLRFADASPVILEHRYVVSDHCPKITKAKAAGSLYEVFTKTNSLVIAGADEIIRAVSLKAAEAKLLDVTVKSPAIEVTAIGFLDDADRTPLWWERTLYRGDQYEFHSRLGPIQTATPARGKLR